jgi:RNA ligase
LKLHSLKEILYKNLQTLTLEEYQKYLDEVEQGYIRVNPHPEDEKIIILNYTEKTQFERRWTNETLSARGLILDTTSANDNGIVYILAKPLNKFFNFGENPEYEEDIDFTKIKTIMEKMDGSLGISYFFNGEIRFATRGSFTSEQAIKATEIWNRDYVFWFELSDYIHFPYTIMTEIIYPENRVVVDYGEMEDLVLLAVNDIYRYDKHERFKPNEWTYDDLKYFSKEFEMPLAEQYTYSLEQMLEMKKSITANEEGWILRFENDKRLKIKGDEYLEVHRIKHGMSTKAKYKAWSEGTLKSYIAMLPEEFRPELEKFEDNVERIKDAQFFFLQTLFETISEINNDKKSFALHVKDMVDKDYRKFMFYAYSNGGVIPVDMIRYEIYKNYADYEEVIEYWNKQDF